MDFDTLYNTVVNDIDYLIAESKDNEVTLSTFLNTLCPSKTDVVELLLQKDGIEFKRDGNNLGSKFAVVTGKKYIYVLWTAYLHNVYDSCFDGTDNSIGLNDIISYVRPIDDAFRLKENGNSDFYDYSDNISEGVSIPLIRIKFSDTTIITKQLAIGTEYSYEFIRSSDMYLFDVVDNVKEIGYNHNVILLSKFIDLLQQDLNPIKLKHDDSIDNMGVTGVGIYDYFSINKKFKDTFPADTFIGGYYPASKYLVTHNVVANVRDNIKYSVGQSSDTLFGVNKTIYTLDENMTKRNNLEKRFIIYNKASSVVLLKPSFSYRNIWENDVYNNFDNYIRQYFCMHYAFYMQDGCQRFLFEVI